VVSQPDARGRVDAQLTPSGSGGVSQQLTPGRGAGPTVALLALLAAVGVVVAVRWGGGPDASQGPLDMTAALALTFTPLGAFVLNRVPKHPIGRLMIAIGLLGALAAVCASWTSWTPIAWIGQWAWWPPVSLVPILLLLFPDGRLPSRRWRPLLLSLSALGVIASLALAVAAVGNTHSLLTSAQPAPPGLARTLVRLAVAVFVVEVLCTGAVLGSLVVRWRRSLGFERRQLACLVPAAALLALGVLLDVAGVDGASAVGVAAVPACLSLAVLQYQLYDLDLYVNRGMVWLGMTVLVTVVFLGLAALLGVTAVPERPRLPTLIALSVALTAAGALRGAVQRWVDRLLYGRRDDPYAVLITLARHAEVTSEPMAVLADLVRTLVRALRVPYAAVILKDHDGSTATAAEFGRPAVATSAFPMIAHGVPIGELHVAARGARERFTGAEIHLLRDVSAQAAQAAEACRLTVDLQRARESLVLAHEDERRRLRRELHDGLGSALVGIRMQAEAFRAAGSAGFGTAVDTLLSDVASCSSEVRRLVDGLRPPALDDGLEAALRAMVRTMTAPGLDIEMDATDVPRDLPAAVEVATYRIAAEAVTNAVTHAHPSRIQVFLRHDGDVLDLIVADDGRHAPFAWADESLHRPDGVGLASMRTRAEELAGHLDIETTTHGVRVHAVLPARARRG
jgi:two-component system, NarL family, sensor kinase